jgi:hypothetical protein
VLERWTGIVVITVAGKRTGDDVVFGEPGDLTLLGSRTLEGLNFRVEPVTKQLVDAGPAPAAVVAGLDSSSHLTAGASTLYSTGVTMRASNVLDTSPPMITQASGP